MSEAPTMSLSDVADIVRRILIGGEYRDDKVHVRETVDEYGIPCRTVVIRTTPARKVFLATSWAGREITEYHPGYWCGYLETTVLPAVEAELFRRKMVGRAKADQDDAKRNLPVDDSELFGAR